MTRGEKITAGLVVAAALAVIAWSGGTFSAHADIGAGQDEPGQDDDAAITARAARGHLCGDVPGAITGRHPLYRRHDGHAMRRHLVGGGWAWFLNPPTQADL